MSEVLDFTHKRHTHVFFHATDVEFSCFFHVLVTQKKNKIKKFKKKKKKKWNISLQSDG